MTLDIAIHYVAASDEHLRLRLIEPTEKEIAMTCTNDDVWRCEVEIGQYAGIVSYSVEVVGNDGNTRRKEWKRRHRQWVDGRSGKLTVDDRWHDRPADAVFSTSAFTDSINRRRTNRTEVADIAGNYVEIQIFAPQIGESEEIAIAGSSEELGKWEIAKAHSLSDTDFPLWRLRIPMTSEKADFEYKFFVREKGSESVVRWETCENRRYVGDFSDGSRVVCGLRFEDDTLRWRGSGTVIPIFSLRSENGWGIGDFGDLLQMIKWVHDTGQNVLQTLPVNDTTMTGKWTDSYPYNSISSFALHPIYIDLNALLKSNSAAIRPRHEHERHKLNRLDKIDYEKVLALKTEVLRLVYDQSGEETIRSDKYNIFLSNNHNWLDAYAAFCILRDQYQTADISQWDGYSRYDKETISQLLSDRRREADFHRFVQYHLHEQLRKASQYASSLGVVLKGDIPIGISRNSVDAWQNPELFNLDMCAGAPPDDFATDGQNWGFPTYNWDEMAKDGYEWWRARFRKMADYFEAYRIDHILGFFRIWQIPMNQCSGLLGTFYPSLPFTKSEMKDRFGFEFDHERHATPTIADGEEITGITYCDSHGAIHPIEPLQTQKAVLDRFGHEAKNNGESVGGKLFNSITNRLFIADLKDKEKYHPRIDGRKTEVYNSLPHNQQLAYDALHNDYFYFRHNQFWGETAMKKLPPLVDETDMLVCGEDLGMIPACVAPTMKSLDILSLEVQRMPKKFGEQWANPANYPYMSVSTTSTHDMPTLRQWLDENQEKAKMILKGAGVECDHDFSSPRNCEVIISDHLKGTSMLCVLPWQDWMSIDGENRRKEASDEQINDPSAANHYWCYRMHLNVEQLGRNERLRAKIQELNKLRR